MVFRHVSAAALAFLLLPAVAPAETLQPAPSAPAAAATEASPGHAGHGTAMPAWKGDQGASSRAFAESNLRMHAGMDIEFTGDADVDFARAMIAHHEGAVDMARILIEHGSDPELRALAEAVIATQSEEIAFMRDWLARRGETMR